MKTSLVRIFLIAIFLVSGIGLSFATVEQELSAMERYEYTSQEFQDVLNIIHYYHPQYSRDKIGRLIVMAYYELQGHFRDVSLYEVALGIKSHARDRLGIDLEHHVVTYLNAKIKK
ncbi:MAG: hypothetical protein JXD21_01920 [Candidatus Omnitrophica bacterium]|nr:hypothetical protein [Candidatus Omnitrophota bacterium]